MTLVGYFNSLRELAGMRRLVEDDVQNRLRHMDQHGLAKRKSPLIEELTSRKSSTDIPRVLDLMEATFDPVLEAERAHAVKEKRIPNSRRPIDVLLATNMISVGVDIKRLGLMVVGGHRRTPQSISRLLAVSDAIALAWYVLFTTGRDLGTFLTTKD